MQVFAVLMLSFCVVAACQATQTAEQQTPETGPALHEPEQAPHNECWSSAQNDKDVRVVEQRVTAGRLVHKVQPKYPKAARQAHIEGTVVLCALIRKDGKIAKLRPLSGPAELIDPSLKAVRQWVYKPYLIDSEAVDVETDIHINFKLN